ncbi:MAG: extracellular solute-binding protein [Bacilli bacterium]|nr:extracellular solute-binding protein [Bacilli bacterium]
MKKLVLFMAVFALGFVFVACNGETTTASTAATTTTTQAATTTTTTQAQTTATTTGTTAATTAATTATTTVEKTIITYCGWNVGTEEENNLVRRTIAAFNAQSDTIEIQIVAPSGNYDEFLATQAAAGTFPDIVLAGNVPNHIILGYAADITALTAADDEWLDVPVSLRDAITYDEKVFAVPSSMHYLGLYANLDLIDNSGVLTDFTALDYSLDDWVAAVEAATDTTHTDGTSTAGIVHPGNFINFVPYVLDQEATEPLGITHFALAGDEFLFNSQPVKDALALIANMVEQGWSVSAYSTAPTGTTENPLPSERETLFGNNWDGNAFRIGQVAFAWEGTWGSAGLADAADGVFDIQFVGLPGASVVGVSDFMTISKTAEDLEAAYEVAKWLTFGIDGVNNRFDIIANTTPDTVNGEVALSVNGLPINNTQSVIDAWFVDYPVPGVQEFFEGAAAGTVTVLVEGNKFVPGFIEARFNYDTGIEGATTSRPDWEAGRTLSIGDLIWDAQSNLIVYSDYMTQQLQDSINYTFIMAQLELQEAIDNY